MLGCFMAADMLQEEHQSQLAAGLIYYTLEACGSAPTCSEVLDWLGVLNFNSGQNQVPCLMRLTH